MRKLILLTLFILSTFVISAFDFTIATKPGIIRTKHQVISLVCKDSVCFYNIDLPAGDYIYEANDGTSTKICVTDTEVLVENDSLIYVVQ